MIRSPVSFGARILGTCAALLLLFLLVGFLLPSRWEAERSLVIDAAPGRIFPLLASPRAWRSWTPWPDSGLVASGPASGAGARMSWDDPNLGAGVFEIVTADAPRVVRYRVSVQNGTMRTEGVVRLATASGGTRVSWVERGDFGSNPLMGYWALAMPRAQGRELEKSLARLAEVVRDSASASEAESVDSTDRVSSPDPSSLPGSRLRPAAVPRR